MSGRGRKRGHLLFFNSLNELDRQLLLVLSAVDLNDRLDDQKSQLVSKLFDRNFCLLQLLGCYDSHSFDDAIISLNKKIRNQGLDEIKAAFHEQLLSDIQDARGMRIPDVFDWALFSESGLHNLGKRFIRYFYARIDKFIEENTGLRTDSYHNLVKNVGQVNGHQIEHIFGENPVNRALFPTEEDFYKERNRLGALLLVRSRDNQSMGNKEYATKLPAYEHQTLWARSL